MKFRRLRLAGFKSFVDPATLHIEDGLTGVVGPNGCGKSNLLEAMRWTMGESSPKSLRGGGMEDVIFAGTDRRPSRDVAEVVLSLTNEDRRAPAPFNDSDTIEVSRRIERGLGSDYRINGRDVRQKDVQLLFADAATGAHSPALVSQGRVGAIVNAKPQDRRQLLEEAAGIAGLHVRRKEAEQKLRQAEANLERLSDLLAGLESQAAALRRQARAAERYSALTERITLGEAMLLYAKWAQAKADAEREGAALDALQAKIGAAEGERDRLVALQTEAKVGLPALREAEREAEQALARQESAEERIAAEIAELERRIEGADNAAETAKADLGREDEAKADGTAALERLTAEATRIAAARKDADSGLPKLQKNEDAAAKKADAREHELANALAALADARGQRETAERTLASAQDDARRANAEAERIEERRGEAVDGAALEKDAADARARFDGAAADLDASEAALADMEEKRRAAEDGRAAASAKLSESRGALAAMTSERDAIARQLAAAEREASHPLIDEVRAEAGYEAALAAILGDAARAELDDGDAAMAWLETGPPQGLPKLPKGAEPLIDHIMAPDRLGARLSMTGLVAAGEGRRLQGELKPGQALVDRDGGLWRWDGYRASGGREAAIAGQLAARNRLEVLDARVADLEAEVGSAQSAFVAAEKATEAATAKLADTRADRNAKQRAVSEAEAAALKADAAVERAKVQADDLANAAREAEQRLRESEARLERARQVMADLPSVDRAAIAEEQARRAAEEARSALAQIRAERQAQSRRVEELAGRAGEVDEDIAAWTERLARAERHVEALNARIAEADKARTEAENALADKREALTSLAPAHEAAEAARDEARAARETAERESSVHDEAVDEAREALSALREERGRLDAQQKNHEERRVEMNRISAEKFQAPVHVLPGKLGFEEDEASEEEAVKAALDKLTTERERMGPVNLRAERELEELRTEIDSSNADSEDLHAAIARLRGSIGSINREGRARLLTAFEEVNRHFESLFTGLFGGGKANLELIESDDPLTAGLEVMAQPPGKALQSLSLLSGGEQALTAVALIFAIFLTNPAPICVLDEVDAPLDDANVERFCDLLDRMTMLTDTRFLIVTHNAVTMSRMHRLFGVTMEEQGVSQLVSVDLGGAERLAAA